MDQVLFTMPDNLRDFLIATTIVQELQIQMLYGAAKDPPLREQNFNITIRLDEKFSYLEPCLQVVKNLVPIFDYSGWNEYSRGEFNNFIDFDFELAKRLAKPNKKHITEAFGVKIGTYLNALFFGMFPSRQCQLGPLMFPKRKPEDKIRVGIEMWDDLEGAETFKGYIENNHPELSVSFSAPLQPHMPLELFTRVINQFDIFIGPASAASYIAASLEKGLIEIFETEEDQWLYNNKNLKYYASTVGTPTASYMWYVWESLCPSLLETLSDTKSPSPLIPTDRSAFIAESVDEKLSVKQDQL